MALMWLIEINPGSAEPRYAHSLVDKRVDFYFNPLCFSLSCGLSLAKFCLWTTDLDLLCFHGQGIFFFFFFF